MSNLAEQIRKAEERVAKLKQEQAEEEQKREAAIEAEVIRWLKVKRSDQWAQWLADAANRLETERRRRSQRAKKAHVARRAKEAQAEQRVQVDQPGSNDVHPSLLPDCGAVRRSERAQDRPQPPALRRSPVTLERSGSVFTGLKTLCLAG